MSVLSVILAFIVSAPATSYAQPTDSQQSNVTPAVGPPGTRFAFVAFGFNDDEQIGVWLNTPDGRAVAADAEQLNGANGDGRADWYLTVPTDAQPGMWQMVARGIDSGVERVIPFEVR